MRKKAGTDDIAPSIAPGETTSKQFRRNPARLVQKIYEVDPLRCPNCEHRMRIISILESGPVVEKILERLDPWDVRNRDLPYENDSHILRTRLRRFGLPNPAIRLSGMNPPARKKKRTLGSVPNCGRKKAVSHVCRAVSDLPQTIFNPSAIFARSLSDSTTTPGNN